MSWKSRAVGAALALALLPACAAGSPLQVRVDSTEAEAALAILEAQNAGREPAEADWARLFASEGYLRLKQREAAMKRAFTDEEFKAFLRSPEARQAAPDLRKALAAWKARSQEEASRAALAYLPKGATLRATVYFMIKPRTNSFVFETRTNPAIFLYLDPNVPGAKAQNTMAHELHHIGLSSACSAEAPKTAAPAVAALRPWISAFGEGLAMMAAAGGPKVHPHALGEAEERAEWDANVARFDEHLAEQDRFFRQVLAGQAGDEAAIEAKMRGYFGVQGPWYTVGWRMAEVIETAFGRQRAIDAFCRSETLLSVYNEAARRLAATSGRRLPLWDDELARRLAEG
jgi:hypothetical protein